MALPIPRPHIVARVNRIIAPFKSEVVIKDLPKGQQYQIAQIKMSPEVYRRENRIPHLAIAEKMYESSLIKSLQEKFPQQPVISLRSKTSTSGVDAGLAGIVSQFEHPE